MPREMLKLRKGDSAIMIKTDGSVELAGLNNKPLMDENGHMSPIILFAAAWAKKDQALINHMVQNFKNTVREGYFGPDAQNDLKRMEEAAASAAVTTESASGTATFESTTQTNEKYNKQKEEEKRLESMAKSKPNLKAQKQREKLMADAVITEKPMTAHKLPDLSEEEQSKLDPNNMDDALKILNSSDAKTPEEAQEVLNDFTKKKEEPIVGNVTIEEEVGNENK